MNQFILILKIAFTVMFIISSNKYEGCGSKVKLDSLKITQLALRVESYRFDMGYYPKSLIDLTSEEYRVNFGALAEPKDLIDVWKNKYFYKKLNNNYFEILSLGEDGKVGGIKRDSDLLVSKTKPKSY